MGKYRVISSDSHVVEPMDLWTTRMESKFKDRAPYVVAEEDGEWWFCDGLRITGVGLVAQSGVRFDEPEKLKQAASYANVREGGWDPDEHVKDMKMDGVDAELLFPSFGFMMYNVVPDGELLSAVFYTYNDWLTEFCNSHPDQLKGVGLVNLDDIETGVAEMKRCVKNGMSGVMIPAFPPEGRPYSLPDYEPVWATAQDLGIPLHLHVATYRPGVRQELRHTLTTSKSFVANQDHWVRMSLGDIIFSGVFERYPKLMVGSVEFELSWIPHFLDRIDYTQTQRAPRQEWYQFKEDMLPSDYFHRNVFVGFQEDSLGISMRHIIGVDNLLWGSDYPHPEGTFPRSQEILKEILTDCTEEEKVKIVGGNAARIYGLN